MSSLASLFGDRQPWSSLALASYVIAAAVSLLWWLTLERPRRLYGVQRPRAEWSAAAVIGLLATFGLVMILAAN